MNTNKNKRKSAGYDLTSILIIAGILGLILTIYIGYRAAISNQNLFSVSLLALIAGLLLESFRITRSWKAVIGVFAGAYLLSLFAFMSGKRENGYNFENHIAIWPYFFIVLYTIIFGSFFKNKVTTKLSEGMTLLLSISLIYWTIDYGFMHYHNWFSITLMAIGFLLSCYSLLHALTNIPHSRSSRLTLSIWSTVITFAFAIDNIIRVFNHPEIESLYFSDGFYIGIQYFFLGISAVYIMQNYMLLAGFLPSKNSNFKRNLKENSKAHLDRYSDQQTRTAHALFCIAFAGSAFFLNHQFQLLPRHTMIWLVFLTFPFALHLISKVFNRRN